MTEKKHVASSLLFMMTEPIVQSIMNRSEEILPVIKEVSDFWKFDLFSRRPGPAYYDENGQLHTTDLDLAVFLYSLAGRNAVINIPTYKSKRVSAQRKDQQVTSKYNRHGEVINVGANKEFFSFNIRIKDLNVVGENEVGAPRTFMLTDLDGSWYKGWQRIEFVPTINENKFITENSLWTGNKIYFKHFVSPNRWTSFFGRHFVITKMLIERLREEAKYYNSMWKMFASTGLEFPEGEGPSSYEYSEKEKGIRKKIQAFEVKIQHPPFENEFPQLEPSVENMVYAYNRQKLLTYTVIPRLQFAVRATELAHFRAPERMPFWLKNVKWEHGYKEGPRKRTLWDRLPLYQLEVGKPAVSILKRVYEKSTEVAA